MVKLGKSEVRKRSIALYGKKTSVSLEEEFWNAAREIAFLRGLSLFKYFEEIGQGRGNGNLSSAIRLAVLDHFVSIYRGTHRAPVAGSNGGAKQHER
jgi:predicted DNA-binding ribbon-helix-helix protein